MEDRDNIGEKAAQLACQYEREFGGCSQCVVAAIKNTAGGVSDDVFKAATGLAGGIGLTGNTCGALTGGVLVLSTYIGREIDNFADPERIRHKCFKLVRKFIEMFKSEYDSVICYDVQRKIMGRSFNLCEKKEYEEFLAAGGHDDKCPVVCGNAAKWVVEILTEEGLIK